MQLDSRVFDPAAVPAAIRAATDRLRRDGTGAAEALREEPKHERAVDRVIAGPDGDLRLRLLAPESSRAWYLHVHGGGWAHGAADRQDQSLWRLATSAQVTVAAVDYRLAPEHPHPAAVEDCVAAIRWLVANGQRELGLQEGVVSGESAGAHLAACALILLRDAGELSGVAAANLAYGVYDVSMTPSARLYGEQRVVVSTTDLASFAAQYAPAARHRDPDVSPLYADLGGMPRALFSCGTLDPLLDDSLFMAARWEEAGNQAELRLYSGAPHEFLNLRRPISAEDEARGRMVDFVDRALGA